MSRHSDRSSRAHLAVVPKQPRHPQIQGLARRLGHAAVLGGVAQVERVAYSDEVFLALDAKVRKKAMAVIRGIVEKTRANPPKPKTPTAHDRVKVRWTDEFKSRFLFEAPRSRNDLDLCRRLGLPPSCRGAMRRARCRYGFPRASATVKPLVRERAPLAVDLPLAA